VVRLYEEIKDKGLRIYWGIIDRTKEAWVGAIDKMDDLDTSFPIWLINSAASYFVSQLRLSSYLPTGPGQERLSVKI